MLHTRTVLLIANARKQSNDVNCESGNVIIAVNFPI